MSKNVNIADLINYISVDGSGNVVLTTGGQVATQSYVTTAVSNLVNAAPTTLDTLNELAAALGNDANFATTVTNSIATKLPLSGGTLTGALSGTSATFSGNIAIGTNPASAGAGAVLRLPFDNAIRWRNSSNTADVGFYLGTSNLFQFDSGINVGGAATFSSSVTANSTINGYLGTITAGQNPATSGTTPVNAMLNLTNNRGIGMYFGGSYAGNYAQWIQVSDTGNLGVNYSLLLNPNGGNVGIGTSSPSSFVEMSKSSNSGSGGTFPRLAVKNTLATQGDGSSTFNFADILISSGNDLVNMFLATTYAAGTWAPAAIINVSSNHDLQIKTNNTERMRITSGGNVGIGTTNSSARLNVQASANFENATLGTATGTMGYLSANGLYGMYIGIGNSGNTWLQSQRNDGSTTAYNLLLNPQGGNVGIGTSSPLNLAGFTGVDVKGATAGYVAVSSTAGPAFGRMYASSTQLNVGTSTNHSVIFDTNDTERMRITSGGDSLFGKTTNSVLTKGFMVYNTVAESGQVFSSITTSANSYHVYDVTGGTFRFYVSGSGQIYATSTTIASLSDERLKENIKDLDTGLDAIMALRPRKYDWKAESGNTGKNVRGFIAQEVEAILPDLIDEWKKEPENDDAISYKSLKQDFIPILVKGMQELKTENDELREILKRNNII